MTSFCISTRTYEVLPSILPSAYFVIQCDLDATNLSGYLWSPVSGFGIRNFRGNSRSYRKVQEIQLENKVLSLSTWGVWLNKLAEGRVYLGMCLSIHTVTNGEGAELNPVSWIINLLKGPFLQKRGSFLWTLTFCLVGFVLFHVAAGGEKWSPMLLWWKYLCFLFGWLLCFELEAERMTIHVVPWYLSVAFFLVRNFSIAKLGDMHNYSPKKVSRFYSYSSPNVRKRATRISIVLIPSHGSFGPIIQLS